MSTPAVSRRTPVALCLLASSLVIVLTGCPAKPSAQWAKFTSDEGWFSIDFPEPPEIIEQPLPNALDIPVMRHMYAAGTPDLRGSYMVEWQEFPEELAKAWPEPAEMRRHLKQAEVDASGGTVISEDVVTSGTHEGLQFTMRIPATDGKPMVALTRIFVVKNRTYRLSLIKTTTLANVQTEGARFVDSFRLLEP